MKFGPVPVREAAGARLAHSVRAGRRFPKGHVLTPVDIRSLVETGIETVAVARLEAGDLWEDDAARRLGAALCSAEVSAADASTGRCNLHAKTDGLFVADKRLVDDLNGVHPGITLATLADASVVRDGRMVATVKIIPFAVPEAAIALCEEKARGTIAVRPFVPLNVTMISTVLPTLKASVVDRTENALRARLTTFGATLGAHLRVSHCATELAGTLRSVSDADAIVVFGASAVSDPDDVIPAAVRKAGGIVDVVGMPVDPGNLLCAGRIGTVPVLGAPGCARSPVENGFDWALQRVAAGLPVSDPWVRSLGVGGLLMEIASRPSPRERSGSSGKPAAILLAAGRSTRMGEDNKLTRLLDDKPLVAHAADALLLAGAGPVTVVTGHDADAVREALDGRDLVFTHNPHFARGMSTSLRAGLEAVRGASGALVALGDMPDLDSADLAKLLATFAEHDGARIVAARDPQTGRRGNPVVWPAAMFPQLMDLSGDRGARAILLEHADDIVSVDVEGAALDLDTPDAFTARARS